MDFFYTDRWRILMNVTKTCPPKEFGAHVCNKKYKMRGGVKRK